MFVYRPSSPASALGIQHRRRAAAHVWILGTGPEDDGESMVRIMHGESMVRIMRGDDW